MCWWTWNHPSERSMRRKCQGPKQARMHVTHVTQHDVHSQNIDYHRVGCRVLPKQRVKGDIVHLSFLDTSNSAIAVDPCTFWNDPSAAVATVGPQQLATVGKTRLLTKSSQGGGGDVVGRSLWSQLHWSVSSLPAVAGSLCWKWRAHSCVATKWWWPKRVWRARTWWGWWCSDYDCAVSLRQIPKKSCGWPKCWLV